MKYDVFISYSRRDYIDNNKQIIPGNIVSKIKELLDVNNISYWFDEEGVFSGDAFASVVAHNIKASTIFLFISSEHSNASEWTSNEVATAHAYKKKIIPFRYDDSIYNDSVIIYIARLDYIEYRANPEKALSRLLASIKSYLKEVDEKKEKERLEEDLRQQKLRTRHEIERKIQEVDKKIKFLEEKKVRIEEQYHISKKRSPELLVEKKFVENNLEELHHSRLKLIGLSEDVFTDRSQGFFQRIFYFKDRNWFVNFVWIAILLFGIWRTSHFVSGIFMIPLNLNYYPSLGILNICALYTTSLSFCLLTIIAYKILQNSRDAFFWILILCIYSIIAALYSYWINDNFNDAIVLMGLVIPFMTLIVPTLFIRKNMQSAWSLLKRHKGSFKQDKIQMSIIGFVILWLIVCIGLALIKKY